VRTLGNLGLAGILLVLVGAWAAAATALPALATGVAGCALLQTVSVAFVCASWRPAARRDGPELAALCTSWAATVPGILLVAGLAVRSDPPRAGDLLLTTNLLWLVVAPYLFFTSGVTSPPKRGLRSLSLARTAHVAAWLSSSFLTLTRWL
jgi:hypothetical protein